MSAFLLGIGFRADMGTCIRKLVLLKMIDACEDDGSRIFPAIATVAKAAQCSGRQVQREIRAFLDIGLITLVREGGKGRRSTNEYALDLDVLGEIGRHGWDAYAARIAGVAKGDTVSPFDDGAKGDTGDTLRVTPETPKGDNGSRTTPPDSSLDPSEEREARAGADASGSEEGDPDQPVSRSETPGTADFEKRVMRFCNGRGFTAGPWPDWDTSSPGWIASQFAKLDEADRQAAERWRDAYLRDIAQRRKRPTSPGVFLRDRLWTGLDPMLLVRAEKAGAQGAKPAEPAKPEGWAKACGPVWAAALHVALIEGPERPEYAPDNGLWLSMHLKRAWPKVAGLLDLASMGRGAVYPPHLHGLRDAVEFVPVGTDVFAAWQAEYRARGWPDVKIKDDARGAYFPKSGPSGLAAFEALNRAAREKSEGLENDHGAKRHAG